jgi:hypothetical protein
MNPESEMEKVEKEIEKEIEKCAQKSEAKDPRYVGFSSEDYMKEIEEKKIAQKFVGSLGKDDEEVEKEIKEQQVDEIDEDSEDKKKKHMPAPPSKKPKATLREKLGLTENTPKKTPTPPTISEDFDFLGGGSTPQKPVYSASVPEDTEELLQLTNLTPSNNQTDLVNPSNDMDMIDFGTMPTSSNTGQRNHHEVDLLVDMGGAKNQIASSASKMGTGGMNMQSDMFKDINSDLFDLSGLNLGGSSNKKDVREGQRLTGASTGNQNGGVSGMINGVGTGKAQKKDLNINEFDFI